MTLPPPDQPATTKLDDARAQLFAALARVWVRLGWPAERAHLLPPASVVAPAAWVDVPTLHQTPTQGARAVAAIFPLMFVVNGAEQAQVEMQDRLLAYAWDELDKVKVAGYQSTVQTFGPEDVDTGGVLLRGLVARVQVTLQTRTLCPQTLVQNTDEGTP